MLITKTCEVCSADFEAGSARARYCSPAHRSQAYRDRRRTFGQAEDPAGPGVTPASPSAGEGSSVQAALAAALQAIGKDTTPVGQALLVVGDRIDRIGRGGSVDSGAALSTLVLRLSTELDKLDKGAIVPGVEDEVGKAREARDRKRNSG